MINNSHSFSSQLLSLTLAVVATLVNSEAGFTYTAEPFNNVPRFTDIAYTAEPFKTAAKTEIKNAGIQPINRYSPITSFNTAYPSYPYSLPLPYNTFPSVSNLYTNSLPMTSRYYNTRPISGTYSTTVPASTRSISAISSPLVRALYNPAVVQPLSAIKHMSKREAEADMTYTAEPFKAVSHNAVPSKIETYTGLTEIAHPIKSVSGYTGMPINFPNTYPVTYNSFVNPTYPTAYSFPSTYRIPHTSTYMYPSSIHPSTYTHPSNFGLCLNNMGAQVPC